MTNKITAGWYVLYTKPRHERKVAEKLADAEIKHYLPLRKTLRSWHDRKKYIDVPLFPSYVFIYIQSMQEYYYSLDLDGVFNYVRLGKEVARVSNKVIDDLCLFVQVGEDIEVSEEQFLPGQQVVIRHGVLTGYSCEIVEYKGKRNIVVRVDLLKRNILVSLPSEHLMLSMAYA